MMNLEFEDSREMTKLFLMGKLEEALEAADNPVVMTVYENPN